LDLLDADAGGAEIVRAGLHDQAIHPHHRRLAAQDLLGDEILARAVCLHNRMDQVLRYIAVVGQQLLGVLRQAIAAIAKAGVVVMATDTRVEANAVDDLPAIQPVGGGVGV